MIIVDNQSITINRVTEWDRYKQPVAYAAYIMGARVTNEIVKTTNPAGDEVITTLTVLIRAAELNRTEATQILYTDELTFTDEFGNETRRVPQNIAPARGFSGKPSFVRVLV